MARKCQTRRIISLFLSISIALSILLSNTALAYQEVVDTADAPARVPDPVPAPAVEAAAPAAAEAADTRTLEELVAAGFVRLDQDGNIAMVQVSDESGLSTRDAMELLGGGLSYSVTEPSQSAPNRQTLDALGLSSEAVTAAADLHGSKNVFFGEVSALVSWRDRENMDNASFHELLTLIQSGYTLGQAQAAVCAARVMSLDIDALCDAKALELKKARQADENGDVEENDAYFDLAVKLGVPSTLVETYLTDTAVSANDLLERFNTECESAATAEVFNTDKKTAAEQEVNTSAQADDIMQSSAATPYAAGAVSYTPEQVLDDPFGYTDVDSGSVNLATGSYIYRETDLTIPGVNGLDLTIQRQFDSSSSYLQTPSSAFHSAYNNTKVLRTTFDAFVSKAGSNDPYERSIMLWSAYTFLDSSSYNTLAAMEREFTPGELDLAMAQLAGMTQETKDWVFGVRDTTNNVTYGMVLRPTVESVGSRLNSAFTNFGMPYDYMVEEYGLGHGWRLGFSAVERYLEGVDDPTCYRLITSEGYRYKVDFSGASLPSNLEGYTLKDLRLEQTGNGYPGAAYTLFYKDGKREYFDANGRNIAIVDRYGNTITLEYTLSQGTLTQIKITDTLGNVVLYSKSALSAGENHYLPGKSHSITNQYDTLWTLTLNGNIVRSYYSFANPNLAEPRRGRELKAAGNELGELTVYMTSITTRKFNCVLPTPGSNDAQYGHALLTQAKYPTGRTVRIGCKTSGYDRFHFSGYTGASHINSYSDQYVTDNDASEFMATKDRFICDTGDHTGYYGYIGSDSGYTSSATYERIRQVAPTETDPNPGSGRYILKTRDEVYTYNAKGLLIQKEMALPQVIQDEQIKSLDDFSANYSDATIGTREKTTYSYNGDRLLSGQTIQRFTLPGSSSSRTVSYQYTYDDKGNLLTQTMPNGQKVTYTYSPDYSILLSKTYKQDASTTIVEANSLTADKKGIAASTVTSNGTLAAKSEYSYDGEGRITLSKIYADAASYTQREFVYADGSAQPTESKTLNVKSATGQLVAGSPGYSDGVIAQKAAYNDRGLQISATDGNGNTTYITYDAAGRVTKVTRPDGAYASYSYALDPANCVSSVTYRDEGSNRYIYKYDPFGRLVEVYDLAINKPLLNRSYDSAGNLSLEVTRSLVGADQRTYHYYDLEGRIIETGALHTDNSRTILETYAYDDGLGQVTHTVCGQEEAHTSVTRTTIDSMGYVTREEHVNNTSSDPYTYINDYLGNCVQYTSAYTDKLDGDFTTRTAYDYAGRPTAVTDALNHTTAYSYDWQGNQISATDPKGTVNANSYDALGRLLQTTQPIAASSFGATRYAYDANGNVTKVQTKLSDSPERWSAVDYRYDAQNLLTQTASHAGEDIVYYTQYYYDVMGNPLRMYTGLSAPLTITGLDQVSGGSGGCSVTKYSYDRFGNQLTMTDPLGQTESRTYDLTGALLTQTDRNGALTSFTYDARGRLLDRTATPASGAPTSVSYTYAVNGKKISESDGITTTTYFYDAWGRMFKTFSGNTERYCTYNLNGQPILAFLFQNIDTDGKTYKAIRPTMFWDYDAAGRLTRVALDTNLSTIASYTYDANGNPSTVTYGNGVTESFTYNKANLVTQVRNAKGGTVLSQYDYTYDLAGRQLSKTDHTGKVASYSYDDLGQLLSEVQSKNGATLSQRGYQYDPSFNRSAKTGNDALSYQYDLNNRLTGTASGEVNSFTYAPNGGLLTWTRAAQTLPNGTSLPAKSAGYTYDAENRLTSVTGDAAATYTYGPDGLRASKMVGGATTDFVYDGDQVVYDNTDTFYCRGLNLIASKQGDELLYYLYNAHGDVVQLTDSQGNVVRQYDYDAFGVEIDPDPNDTNPFRYCGEYFDKETGLYYLRSRYYSPQLGRFLSEDSIRHGQNWYIYCSNDPIRYVDPSGRYETQRRIRSAYENEFHNRAASWLHSHLGNEDREDPEIELWYNVAIDCIADEMGTGKYTSPSEVPDSAIDGRFEGALAERALVTTTVASVLAGAAAQAATKQVYKSLTTSPQYKTLTTFPENPQDFNPPGYKKIEWKGSGNGKIIKWFDAEGIARFEWDEELNRPWIGPHYHSLAPGEARIPDVNNETHFHPGDPIIWP